MRIILADQNQKILWALRTLLDEEADMNVVGEVTDAQTLLMMVQKRAADLVLIDGRLPGGDIGELITLIRSEDPAPVIIVMSSDFEDGRFMLRAGADAFISKGEQPDWLLTTLRQYAGRNKNNRINETHSREL